jgi:predicted nucleic acid-binding protein
MPEVIISDTSCLLALRDAERLHLLEDLFGTVRVTSVVVKEYRSPLPAWVIVSDPDNEDRVARFSSIVDPGEASSIALALEHPFSRLILDDWKGRRLATELGINITGTIGIVKLAKDRAIIAAMRPILQELRKAGLWISDELEFAVLREAGEV